MRCLKIRQFRSFLYKISGTVDRYVSLLAQGEFVIFKFSMIILAALLGSEVAFGYTKDCYMTNSCAGNPNNSVSTESGFSSANMNNIDTVFAQLASGTTTTAVSSDTGFNPYADNIHMNSKQTVSPDELEDTVEH